jgi:ribonuclease BN (tRNA processing enzyme)
MYRQAGSGLKVRQLSLLAALLYSGTLAHAAVGDPIADCSRSRGVAVQVLGSGGPVADDGRASSAYLIWIDGESRVLIDAGGGSFLRFGESRAEFDDLDFVGLSHFHTDHSADFPALLKSGYFSDRRRPLAVAGPAGDGLFPGLDDFLGGLLAADGGAFGYLSGYLDGSGGLVELQPVTVRAGIDAPVTVFGDAGHGLRIDAMPVPHGIVPAVAFRARIGDSAVVFASDQNGSDEAFVDFARGADLLVMHLPIPESARGTAVRLHAKPSRVGRIAAAVEAGTLLLSHFMARSLADLDVNLGAVREAFDGRTIVAEDLGCYTVR